jgi:hypothetical protein
MASGGMRSSGLIHAPKAAPISLHYVSFEDQMLHMGGLAYGRAPKKKRALEGNTLCSRLK